MGRIPRPEAVTLLPRIERRRAIAVRFGVDDAERAGAVLYRREITPLASGIADRGDRLPRPTLVRAAIRRVKRASATITRWATCPPVGAINLVEASGLKPGERVLVIVDEPLVAEGCAARGGDEGRGRRAAARALGGRAPDRATPPRAYSRAAAAADVSFFLSQAPRGDEAKARFQLMEPSSATAAGRSSWASSTAGCCRRALRAASRPADAARGR